MWYGRTSSQTLFVLSFCFPALLFLLALLALSEVEGSEVEGSAVEGSEVEGSIVEGKTLEWRAAKDRGLIQPIAAAALAHLSIRRVKAFWLQPAANTYWSLRSFALRLGAHCKTFRWLVPTRGVRST